MIRVESDGQVLLFPTLRELGLRACKHHPEWVGQLPAGTLLWGWSGPISGPHYRCGGCGAFWCGAARDFIGGSLDFPQLVWSEPAR